MISVSLWQVQFFYPKIKKFIRGNGQNGTEELGSNSGEVLNCYEIHLKSEDRNVFVSHGVYFEMLQLVEYLINCDVTGH